MEIRYIYLPEISSSVAISKRELHHLKVLRVKNGEKIRILDGKGSLYEGILFDDKVFDLTLLKKEELSYKKILMQALIKPQRLEIVLQKACEIGVSEIFLVEMERSTFSMESFMKKKERFDKILIDAIKQSHNLFLPELRFFKNLKVAVEQTKGFRICFYEKEIEKFDFCKFKLKNQNVNYLIGPEGGITEREVDFLKDKDFIFSSLSTNILRSETASIYALALIDYHMSL